MTRYIDLTEICHAMTPAEANAYLQLCDRHEAAQTVVRQMVAQMSVMRERIRRRIRKAEAITGKAGR